MVLTDLSEYQSALLVIKTSIEQGLSKSFYSLPFFKGLCLHSQQLTQIIGAEYTNQLCTKTTT